MPVVKSDRPPAKMEVPDDSLFNQGRNTFLVDKVKSKKFDFKLGSVFPDLHKYVAPTGIFKIPELEIIAANRLPIATMQPEFVLQMQTMVIRANVMLVGTDYHMQVYKVQLPNISDRKVRSYLKKYPFEVAASILHKYGAHSHAFVNRYAKEYDDDFQAQRSYSSFIYQRKSPQAPKTWFPRFYKFGVRFVSV